MPPAPRGGHDRDGECHAQCAAQCRGDDGGRRHRQEQDDGLDDGELIDSAGRTAEGGEVGPCQSRHQVKRQEQAMGRYDIDPRRLGPVDAAGVEGQAGIAGGRDQCPDEDRAAHSDQQAAGGDDEDEERYGRGAGDDGPRVQLQQLTVEFGVSRALRKTVARAPHRTCHIAVAMGLGAVHNEFVCRVHVRQRHERYLLFRSIAFRSNARRE